MGGVETPCPDGAPSRYFCTSYCPFGNAVGGPRRRAHRHTYRL